MIKLPNIKGFVLIGKGFVMAHRPEMLFGASVASTLGAVVLAAKGGYEARGKIDAAKMEKVISPEAPFDTFREYYDEFLELGGDLDVKEKIQLTWLCYAPAGIATLTSIGSTTGLHLVHVKEKKALAQAALAAMEELKSETSDYVGRVLDNVEEKTDKATAEAVRDDALDPDRNGVIQNTDHETEELYLVRDAKSGRDIWSNTTRIEAAVNATNYFIIKNGDCELNTFYSNAGFELTPDGDDWGWSGVHLDLKWDSTTRDDGRPVRRFAFRTDPEKGFDRPIK